MNIRACDSVCRLRGSREYQRNQRGNCAGVVLLKMYRAPLSLSSSFSPKLRKRRMKNQKGENRVLVQLLAAALVSNCSRPVCSFLPVSRVCLSRGMMAALYGGA